jgi:hypothetical protein
MTLAFLISRKCCRWADGGASKWSRGASELSCRPVLALSAGLGWTMIMGSWVSHICFSLTWGNPKSSKKVYPWENQRFGDHPSHSPRFCPQHWFVIQKGVDVGQWGYTKYLRMCIQPVFRHIMCLSVIDISCRWWTNYSVACPNVCVCVCTFCFVVFSFTVFFLCICLCLLCICIHVYECNVCK